MSAIKHMRKALDEFYVKGVSHNMSFLSALVAHPRFAEGRLSTGFIADEYPLGFQVEDVVPEDIPVLLAVAVAVHRHSTDRPICAADQNREPDAGAADDWVVLLGGQEFAVHEQPHGMARRITFEGKSFDLLSDWRPGVPVFRASFDGEPVSLQVEMDGIGYRISYGSSRVTAKVLTPSAAALHRMMPHKPPTDLSQFLVSPMPGQLLKVSVKAGDEVRAGEELVIIEAMKMENVLRAARDAKVKCVLAEPASSLAADQPILEFE